MRCWRWGRLVLVSLGLAGCGLDVAPDRLTGPEPAARSERHVLLAPGPAVQARIRYMIEHPRYITDFFPKVQSLQVRPLGGGLYQFDSRATVRSWYSYRPYRLIGTYHQPTGTFRFTHRIPR